MKTAIIEVDCQVAHDAILVAHHVHPDIWNEEEIRILRDSVEQRFEEGMQAHKRRILVGVILLVC